MDEFTKAINTTTTKLAEVMNESKLHPSALALILRNAANECQKLAERMTDVKREDDHADN